MCKCCTAVVSSRTLNAVERNKNGNVKLKLTHSNLRLKQNMYKLNLNLKKWNNIYLSTSMLL